MKVIEMDGELWTPVYEGEKTNLKKVLGVYRKLGVEIKVEPLPLNECQACRECEEAGREKLYRAYVKEKME